MSGEGEVSTPTQPPTSAPDTVEAPASVAVPRPSQSSGHGHGHHHIEFRFLDELKRRNVGRVAILYLVVCWLILEPVHVIFHMLEVPVWANRLVIILMTLGFPAVTIFAWVYELTPEGLKPATEVDPHQSIRAQTGQRLNRAIIAVLALALSYFVVDKFWISKRLAVESATAPIGAVTPETESAVPPISDKSIAVLPFADMSEKKDQEYFSDGMAEEVTDLLSKIPGLRVIGRTSAFQFKGKTGDLRSIGSTLGAHFVVEGSVRRTMDRIRVSVQLINAEDGRHAWSDSYDRDFRDALRVQDDIAAKLVRALQVEVGAADLPPRPVFRDPRAYELYLRARSARAGGRVFRRGDSS
jgi:TolB-like protein